MSEKLTEKEIEELRAKKQAIKEELDDRTLKIFIDIIDKEKVVDIREQMYERISERTDREDNR